MQRPFGLAADSLLKLLERRVRRGFLPYNHLGGLTLSNDTTDATNDISIAIGSARSSVNVVDGAASTLPSDQIDLELPVSIIKQLDVAWAQDNYNPIDAVSGGDRSGGRSSSAIANTTWHVFLIGGRNVKTDILFHDSVTQSSILAELRMGYTAYRRIGSIVRTGGAIKAFTQFDDRFLWTTPPLDFDTQAPGTSAVTATLTVPTGIVVEADVSVGLYTGTTALNGVLFTALVQTAGTPTDPGTAALAPAGNTISLNRNGAAWIQQRIHLLTNTSGQVRYQLFASGASDRVAAFTNGWRDRRAD